MNIMEIMLNKWLKAMLIMKDKDKFKRIRINIIHL